MHEKLSIIDFNNYRDFIKGSLETKKGYTLSKLAEFASVSPSNISQVLSSDRNITPELVLKIANYLELNSLEKEYLLTLVQIEKSGLKELQGIYLKQLSRLKQDILDNSKEDLKTSITLIPDNKKREFYSSWYYAGIHLLTAIKEMHKPEAIAKKINLPVKQVISILDFLVSLDFCRNRNGEYHFIELKTFIGDDLFLKSQHHRNWRIKALSHLPQYDYPNTFFSYPMCISVKDTIEIRELLTKLITKVDQKIINSKPEKLICLNIDWFEF